MEMEKYILKGAFSIHSYKSVHITLCIFFNNLCPFLLKIQNNFNKPVNKKEEKSRITCKVEIYYTY